MAWARTIRTSTACGADLQRSRDRFADGPRPSAASACCRARAPISSMSTSRRSAKPTTSAFCERLVREHGVAAIPVSAFYAQDPIRSVVRFCFAKRDAGPRRRAGAAGDGGAQSRLTSPGKILASCRLCASVARAALSTAGVWNVQRLVPAAVVRCVASLAFCSPLRSPRPSAQEKVVNVYNWSDYIDPTVLEKFTKETGIKVVYDTYDNNEIVETKLMAGKSGYDIVVPSGPFLQRMVARRRASRSSTRPEAAEPEEHVAGDHRAAQGRTTPATPMPSTTCGARPASATTSRRSRSGSATGRSTAGTSCSSRRTSPS